MTLALALVCVAPGAAARPDGPVTRDSLAFADWITPTEKRNVLEWHGAFIAQSEDQTGQLDRFGGILRGLCVRKEEGLSCMARGVPVREDDRFEMDPTADSASLEIKHRGRAHRVSWSAYKDTDGIPGIFETEIVCDEGQGRGGGIVRAAETRGRVFGRRFTNDRDSEFEFWNMLWSGAAVSSCGRSLMDDLRALDSGGTIRMFRPLP